MNGIDTRTVGDVGENDTVNVYSICTDGYYRL